MKFRKKHVVIEGAQFTGDGSMTAWNGDWIEAVQFTGDVLEICNFMGRDLLGDSRALTIPTLDGSMTAWNGDWIVKGIKGEFYPCTPDIVAATYEPVAEAFNA
jgi:hypothetical protein